MRTLRIALWFVGVVTVAGGATISGAEGFVIIAAGVLLGLVASA